MAYNIYIPIHATVIAAIFCDFYLEPMLNSNQAIPPSAQTCDSVLI